MSLHACKLCGSGHLRHTLCKKQFPHSLSSPTDLFCCHARCEMEGSCFITCSAPRWPLVPAALSLWRCGVQTNRPAVSSSILKPTAANGSIALRTLVTKPHAMEQRPHPDSANYSEPLRRTYTAPTDGRTEVCLCTCLVKGHLF